MSKKHKYLSQYNICENIVAALLLDITLKKVFY